MPTYRQKLVASKLVENGGNIGEAMVSAGYSPNTAKTPQKLTTSKGWLELMGSLLPDEMLAKKHRQLLNAKKIIVDRSRGKAKFITKINDYTTVVKALDLAYRVKGYYSNKIQKVDVEISPWDTFSISDDTLKRITGNN